jgi:hypothetical protein
MNRRRCLPARLVAALALACAGAVLVAGCSSSSAPSLFPAVLDSPAPRDDTPLTKEQVKQATDSLVADRNRLCAEAAANGSPNAANCGSDNAASPGATQTAGGAAKP